MSCECLQLYDCFHHVGNKCSNMNPGVVYFTDSSSTLRSLIDCISHPLLWSDAWTVTGIVTPLRAEKQKPWCSCRRGWLSSNIGDMNKASILTLINFARGRRKRFLFFWICIVFIWKDWKFGMWTFIDFNEPKKKMNVSRCLKSDLTENQHMFILFGRVIPYLVNGLLFRGIPPYLLHITSFTIKIITDRSAFA